MKKLLSAILICFVASAALADMRNFRRSLLRGGTTAGGGGGTNVSGMVLNAKLNESSGTTAADSSGHGNNGTASSSAGWTGGNGYDYAGTRTIDFGAPSDLINNSLFTLVTWVNTSTTTDQNLISRARDAGTAVWTLNIEGHKAYFRWSYSSGLWGGGIVGNTSIDDGNWHQVAVTFDGGGPVNIYVDGAADATQGTATGNLWGGTDPTFYTGGFAGVQNYNGKQKTIQFYDRALSAGEINYLFLHP